MSRTAVVKVLYSTTNAGATLFCKLLMGALSQNLVLRLNLGCKSQASSQYDTCIDSSTIQYFLIPQSLPRYDFIHFRHLRSVWDDISILLSFSWLPGANPLALFECLGALGWEWWHMHTMEILKWRHLLKMTILIDISASLISEHLSFNRYIDPDRCSVTSLKFTLCSHSGYYEKIVFNEPTKELQWKTNKGMQKVTSMTRCCENTHISFPVPLSKG